MKAKLTLIKGGRYNEPKPSLRMPEPEAVDKPLGSAWDALPLEAKVQITEQVKQARNSK